jgi:4-amino-4-deoxy-L-arabinose transferase-like glycosyltransferase
MHALDDAAPTSANGWKRYAAVTLLVAAFSSCLVVGSYSKLSHTFDEPTHLAAGLEWLQFHRYAMQTENPPLSRIPLALIPYLSGMRITNEAGALQTGVSLLYGSGDYLGNVTKARLANLLFFWLTLLLTWTLSGGRAQPTVAALATCLVATLPSLVAHSGLATTDVPFVVAFLFALWRWKRVLGNPSVANAAWLGLSAGVALATKFSTIPFLPPAAAALLLTHWWLGALPPAWRSPALLGRRAILAMVVAGIAIWASYGFRIGTISQLPTTFGGYGTMPTTGWVASIQRIRLPAHEFWHGLLFLQAHTKAGHLSYMLGQTSQRGFWMYYPLMLLVKTPLATLGLFLVGGALAVRSRSPVFMGYALGAVGLLVAAATSPINLGIRHVLAVYPLLCMAAAYGVVSATSHWMPDRTTLSAATVTTVVALQVTALAMSFPRQISYYNVVASGRPDYFISDSDLDWGQDVFAMEAYFRDHPVSELYLVPSGSALFCRHDLPPLKPLPVGREVNGWIAVFERTYQLNRGGGAMRPDPCQLPGSTNRLVAPSGWLDWLHRRKPEAAIGSGVLLFHVTDAQGS